MSGRYQTTLFLMLIMVAVVTEANNIGRYPESSEMADYVFALARQSLANCPKCEDCPAPPVCPTCPSFLSNAALTDCPTGAAAINPPKSSAREGVINVPAFAAPTVCRFAIATLPPYTKLRIKCTTLTDATATFFHFGVAATAITINADTPIPSPTALIAVTANTATSAVKCTWTSE